MADRPGKKKQRIDDPVSTTPSKSGRSDKSGSREEQIRVTLSQVLDRPEFTTGLRHGVIAVVVGLVLGTAWRATRHRTAPIAGLLFAGAAVLALREAVGAPDDLLVGLAVLAGATALAEVLRAPPVVELLAALPGAALVANAAPDATTEWMKPVVVLVIVIGGAAAGSCDHRWRRRGLGPVLAAITVAGIYACVPETKRLLVLLGVALPLPLMSWPLALTRLGRAGSYTFVAVCMWAAAIDGVTRPSAILGAAASLGLLVAEPLARALAGRRSPLELVPERLPAVVWVGPVAVIHLGLVFIASRVAGIRPTVDEALSVLLGLAVVVVAIGVGLRQWRPPPLPRDVSR